MLLQNAKEGWGINHELKGKRQFNRQNYKAKGS